MYRLVQFFAAKRPLSFVEKAAQTAECLRFCQDRLGSIVDKWNAANDESTLQFTVSSSHERNIHCIVCACPLAGFSLRFEPGLIQVFPAGSLVTVANTCGNRKARFRMKLERRVTGPAWVHDGCDISLDDFSILLRTSFRDVVVRAAQKNISSGARFTSIARRLDASLSVQFESLVKEREQLLERIVSQQESLQNHIAAEIHDVVLGQMMTLHSRMLSSPTSLTLKEAAGTLKEVMSQLRDVCQMLAPRDLESWGLTVAIEDLANQFAQRTGLDCDVSYGDKLPELDSETELHIYRVVQESLNNIEKHAQAQNVRVRINSQDGCGLVVEIEDDGIGLGESKTPGQCGMGLRIMNERVELIRKHFSANITIVAVQPHGTAVKLEVGALPSLPNI